MPDLARAIATAIIILILASFMGSILKASVENCNKSYPIDYILYNDLFCENK